MTLRTQVSPYVLVGDSLADRPLPDGVAQGVLFTDESTGVIYTLVIDADNTHHWVASGALPTVVDPHLFVATTGSNNNPGTQAKPLRTIVEAFRRLGQLNYVGQATITQIDSGIDEGVDPEWNVPIPPAGGAPILLQGTSITLLGPTAPTGGTAGVQFASVPALATVTSLAPGGANVYRGKFMRFTADVLNNVRCPISSNNGAGGFVLSGALPAPPAAPDLFVIEDVPAVTWEGTLRITNPGGLIIDNLEFLYPDNGAIIGLNGAIQATAVRHKSSVGANGALLSLASEASWNEIGVGRLLFAPPYAIPAGVLPCGSVYDGSLSNMCVGTINSNSFLTLGVGGIFRHQSVTAINTDWTSVIDTGYMQIVFEGLCSLDTGSVTLSFGSLNIVGMVAKNMRPNALGLGAVGAFELDTCEFVINALSTADTATGSDIIRSFQSFGSILFWGGLNPQLNVLPLEALYGSNVVLSAGATPTVTGTVPTHDVVVGANLVTSWANVAGVNAAFTTDVNPGSTGVASSQLCRVGQ